MNPDRITETAQQISRVLPDNQTKVLFSNEKQAKVYDLLASGLNPVSSLDLAQAVLEEDLTDPKTRTRALNSARKITGQIAATLQDTPFFIRDVYMEQGQNRYAHSVLVPKSPAINVIPELSTVSVENTKSVSEEAAEKGLSMKQLKDLTLDQINGFVEKRIEAFYEEQPDIAVIDMYKKISAIFPYHIPDEAYKKAINATKCTDKQIAQIGEKIGLFLMLRSVFSALDFFSIGEEFQEEAVQAALVGMVGKLDKMDEEGLKGINLSNIARKSMGRYIAEKENIVFSWIVNDGLIQAVSSITGSADLDFILTLSQTEQVQVIGKISEYAGISATRVADYFKKRQVNIDENKFDLRVDYDMEGAVFGFLRRESIERALYSLTERERSVLSLRFGLEDGEEWTLDKVGVRFGVTRERIRQIEAKAFRKLRHPTGSKPLKNWINPHSISSVPKVSSKEEPKIEPKELLEKARKHIRIVSQSLRGKDPYKVLNHPLVFAVVQGIPISEFGFGKEDVKLLAGRGYRILRPLLVLPDDILVSSIFRREIEKEDYYELNRSHEARLGRIAAIKQRIVERLLG